MIAVINDEDAIMIVIDRKAPWILELAWLCHARRTWTRTSHHHLRHHTRILVLDDYRYQRRARDLDDGRTPRPQAKRSGHQHCLIPMVPIESLIRGS